MKLLCKLPTREWTAIALQIQRCSVHMSSIYRPINVTPPTPPGPRKKAHKEQKKEKAPEPLSKSLKLLVDNGLIRPSSCFGAFHLLPVALKAMEKLINLIDRHMKTLPACQKLQMSTLTAASLWNATGRLEQCGSELMRVKDRLSKEFILSPTHEEAICDILTGQTISYRQLPLRLYQISEKFRDEGRPRFGLLRSRQFLMKDLYSFDTNLDEAKKTYEGVNQVYEKLLTSLELNWVKAIGATGTVGGLSSHEFHLPCEIGEDSIIHCGSCNHFFNQNLEEECEAVKEAVGVGGGGTTSRAEAEVKCINCGTTSALSTSTSIEVAHSFLLGTKYSKPLDARYVSEDGGKVPMEMGCYGVGVSRLLAAAVEVKSSTEEIRWPLQIAPYLVSIIPPKQGSKEEQLGLGLSLKLYDRLCKLLPNEVIFDDRATQTIGKRLIDTKKLGIPYIIVCGKAIQDPAGPLLELHDTNSKTTVLESYDNIVKAFYDIKYKLNPENL